MNYLKKSTHNLLVHTYIQKITSFRGIITSRKLQVIVESLQNPNENPINIDRHIPTFPGFTFRTKKTA